jgi:flagellar biosynthesis repressor protein FlbT
MPLTISLKQNERVIIGGAVLRNHDGPCRLTIENKVPVLRESSILSPSDATTTATRFYLAVQLLYIDENNKDTHYRNYWPLAAEVSRTLAGGERLVDEINKLLFDRDYYRALRKSTQVVELERQQSPAEPTPEREKAPRSL